MRFARVTAFLFLLTAFAAAAFGQDDDPIRVDSSIVRLNVGVVDGRGDGRGVLALAGNSRARAGAGA